MSNVFSDMELLDRSVYWNIRQVLEDADLAADIRAWAGDGAGYKGARAQKAGENTLGWVVEVEGHAPAEKRDGKTIPEIIVTRVNEVPGTVGGSPAHFYEDYPDPEDGSKTLFRRNRHLDMNYNVNYTVRLVTNSTAQERLLRSKIFQALGQRKYIKVWDDEAEALEATPSLLIQHTGGADVSTTDVSEYLFNYTLLDVWIGEPETLEEDIPQLIQVDPNIAPLVGTTPDDLNGDFDPGDFGSDFDTTP